MRTSAPGLALPRCLRRPLVGLTSFSASLDGSLKDVELPASLTLVTSLETGGGPPRAPLGALPRGGPPGPGPPPVANPPWDTRAPKESVLAWHSEDLIRGEVLDIGCGY